MAPCPIGTRAFARSDIREKSRKKVRSIDIIGRFAKEDGVAVECKPHLVERIIVSRRWNGAKPCCRCTRRHRRTNILLVV